jgi:Uncharacterised nucleotidyltransferase
MPGDWPLPEHVVSLLTLLENPAKASALSLSEWDLFIRVSRSAKVAATLGTRLQEDQRLAQIPDKPAAHLSSEQALAAYQAQMVQIELRQVERALASLSVPIVLLKGAAYLMQRKSWAQGRMLSDVDILVPRTRLDEVERALVAAGWASEVLDQYDQHYYRSWSHELPPMRRADAVLELDVHHTILPLTGRLQPRAEALFDAAVAIPGTPFHALCREDQILHVAAHVFQDSDCANRLRDLIDLDGLLRELKDDDVAWTRLIHRARLHDLERPLWYALRYVAAFLRTPISAPVLAAPAMAAQWAMDRLVPIALMPTHPDRPSPFFVELARFGLYARSMWLRMPLWLLIPHLARKGWRVLGRQGRHSDSAKLGEQPPGSTHR